MIFRNNPYQQHQPTISSAAYSGVRREDVVIEKEQLAMDNDGPLWVKTFRFKKEKTFKDLSGTEVVKIPMTETLYLISKYKTAIWLNAKEIKSLAGMMDNQIRLSNFGGGNNE